jgi:HSP20 family protein
MNSLTNQPATAVTRQPAFTIDENENGARLSIALPGVPKEAVKLTLKQSVLQIEATRVNSVAENWKTHSGPERDINYQLNVRLTPKLDGANVKATLNNGVLSLDIPLREDAKPRPIFVN